MKICKQENCKNMHSGIEFSFCDACMEKKRENARYWLHKAGLTREQVKARVDKDNPGLNYFKDKGVKTES